MAVEGEDDVTREEEHPRLFSPRLNDSSEGSDSDEVVDNLDDAALGVVELTAFSRSYTYVNGEKFEVLDGGSVDAYTFQCQRLGIPAVPQLMSQLTCSEVNLRYYGLSAKDGAALAACLKDNTRVTSLDLDYNVVTSDGAMKLAEALATNTTLQSLSLAHNKLDSSAGTALADVLESNGTLTSLFVGGNSLRDKGVVAICSALDNNFTLAHLDFSANDISESGCSSIAQMLGATQSVKSIDISWNNTRGKALVPICTALATNMSLTSLSLAWNGLGDKGILALVDALRTAENKYLTHLDVRNCRLLDVGLRSLANLVAHHGALQSIFVDPSRKFFEFYREERSALLGEGCEPRWSAVAKPLNDDEHDEAFSFPKRASSVPLSSPEYGKRSALSRRKSSVAENVPNTWDGLLQIHRRKATIKPVGHAALAKQKAPNLRRVSKISRWDDLKSKTKSLIERSKSPAGSPNKPQSISECDSPTKETALPSIPKYRRGAIDQTKHGDDEEDNPDSSRQLLSAINHELQAPEASNTKQAHLYTRRSHHKFTKGNHLDSAMDAVRAINADAFTPQAHIQRAMSFCAMKSFRDAASACLEGFHYIGFHPQLMSVFREAMHHIRGYRPRWWHFACTVRMDCVDSATHHYTLDCNLGDPLTVLFCYSHNYKQDFAHSGLDWIGLFKIADTSGDIEEEDKYSIGTVRPIDAKLEDEVEYEPGEEGNDLSCVGVPQGNEGEITFSGVTRPGLYEFRYCIQATMTCVARSQVFKATFPNVELTVSKHHELGKSITVEYHVYNLNIDHPRRDWIGLFYHKPEIEQETAAPTRLVYATRRPGQAMEKQGRFWNIDRNSKSNCVFVCWVAVPPQNRGTVTLPKYYPTRPGNYEFRYYWTYFTATDEHGHYTNESVVCSHDHGETLENADDLLEDLTLTHTTPPPSFESHWLGTSRTVIVADAESKEDDHGVRMYWRSPIESRHINFYLCTSFYDMQDERVLFLKDVLPEARKMCTARQVGFCFTDLRFGWEGDASLSGESLAVALACVENCFPYFYGCLGDVYGWVPERVDRRCELLWPWMVNYRNEKMPVGIGTSITELEIAVAVFKNPRWGTDLRNIDHTHFYFRNAAYAGQVAQELRQLYVESDPKGAAAQACLKAKLRQLKNNNRFCREYETPSHCMELLKADLLQAIATDFPASPIPNDFDSINLFQFAFASRRRLLYFPLGDTFDVLEKYIEANLNRKEGQRSIPLCLTGAPGAGKTALLANFVSNFVSRELCAVCSQRVDQPHCTFFQLSTMFLTKNHRKCLLIVTYVGMHDVLTSTAVMYRLMHEIKRWWDLKDLELPPISEPIAVAESFMVFVRRAVMHGQSSLILIVDGVNYLADARNLSWITQAMPPKVSVILSSDEGSGVNHFLRGHCSMIEFAGISSRSMKKKMAKSFLDAYASKLTKTQTSTILKCESADNILFLRALLDDVRTVGLFETHGDDGRLAAFLQAQSIEELYHKMLPRMEQDHMDVKDLLCYIALSRQGLSELELMMLLQMPSEYSPINWAQMMTYLQSFFVVCQGIIRFANQHFARAIGSLWLATAEDREPHQETLVNFWFKQPHSVRKVIELPALLCTLERYDRLSGLITTPEIFVILWTPAHRHDFMRYVKVSTPADQLVVLLRTQYEKRFGPTSLTNEEVPADSTPSEMSQVLFLMSQCMRDLGMLTPAESFAETGLSIAMKRGFGRNHKLCAELLRQLVEILEITLTAPVADANEKLGHLQAAEGGDSPAERRRRKPREVKKMLVETLVWSERSVYLRKVKNHKARLTKLVIQLSMKDGDCIAAKQALRVCEDLLMNKA